MTTDSGFSFSDNITKINNPIINMNSESGLSQMSLSLEISDGKGFVQFNIGSFSSILSIGKQVRMKKIINLSN